MRIDNNTSNIISIYQNNKIFKEDMILKGEVIDLLDKTIVVEFKEQGIIRALLEAPMESQVGDEISFLVKSVDSNLVQLKALSSEGEPMAPESLENDLTYKLLEGFNLRATKENMSLIKYLMKYNVPLTEENMNNSIIILDKLLNLANISDDEKVVSIDNTMNPMIDTLDEENFQIKNTDIKYLLITEKTEYPDSEDLTTFLDKFIGTEGISENQDDFMKIISFLIKNNIKPSINNILKLKELNEDPLEFIKEVKDAYEVLGKTQGASRVLSKEGIQRPLVEVLSFNRKNIVNTLKELIKNIYEESDPDNKNKLVDISDKIIFLEELNKDISHLFYPIYFNDNEMEGILTFIKEERKKERANNKIYIFLKIPTENLGIVKVNCHLVGDSLYVKMNVKEEDLELFESTQKLLIEKISSIGYSLKKIEFIIDEDFEIIDLLNLNISQTYSLDIKV